MKYDYFEVKWIQKYYQHDISLMVYILFFLLLFSRWFFSLFHQDHIYLQNMNKNNGESICIESSLNCCKLEENVYLAYVYWIHIFVLISPCDTTWEQESKTNVRTISKILHSLQSIWTNKHDIFVLLAFFSYFFPLFNSIERIKLQFISHREYWRKLRLCDDKRNETINIQWVFFVFKAKATICLCSERDRFSTCYWYQFIEFFVLFISAAM